MRRKRKGLLGNDGLQREIIEDVGGEEQMRNRKR